jgi:hypothetical protein
MKPLLSLVIVLTALLLGGCKNREAEYIGTWTADTGGLGPLELKSDKTFAMTIPAPGQMTGKWSMSDSGVKLNPENLGGKTKEQALKELEDQIKKTPQLKEFAEPFKKLMNEIELKANEKNSTLTMTTTVGKQSQTVVFKKGAK